MSEGELLRERQVRQQYNLGIPWLRRARREGRGPKFLRLRRMIFYRRRDIEAYLMAHEVQTTEK